MSIKRVGRHIHNTDDGRTLPDLDEVGALVWRINNDRESITEADIKFARSALSALCNLMRLGDDVTLNAKRMYERWESREGE